MIHRVKMGSGVAFHDLERLPVRALKSRHRDVARDGKWHRPVVLHITNNPTPYRLPYFLQLRRALLASGFDLRIFFLGRGKRRREWHIGPDDLRGLDYTVARNQGKAGIGEIARTIAETSPEAVVLAWAMDLVALRVMLHCLLRRIPCILFTGETSRTAAGRSHATIRALLRSIFFRLADGFLTYGTRSTEYLLDNGVPQEKISTGINVVDTDFFGKGVDALRMSGVADADRARHRRSDGTPFACHLLLVNYMIPGKGIGSTLRALKALGREDIALHIVGSGPREADHRATAAELGLEESVFFHGYKQIDELVHFYAFSDVVLFPSSVDIFGLVMVEAAAAGLPVIASRNSGGTVDVVLEGETGLVVDPRDTSAYARAIAALADDADLRCSMGFNARAHAMTALTLERSAGFYLDAVHRALGQDVPTREEHDPQVEERMVGR